jgi:glycosyltransferase involved in cell wall biosynthesis
MRILHVGWGFSPWRPGGLIIYAEDLMAAQVARGHQVSYFLSGRHYPYVSGPRLKRWQRQGVAMHEVINPPIVAGLEHGTRAPERDLSEPQMEAAFDRVLKAVEPDVLHIQELHGLPSSLIEVASAARVPTLMTLQDYGPLCTTLRLFDATGRRCMRRDVGADCVARNAEAAVDAGPLIAQTFKFEIARARRVLGLGPRVDFVFARRHVRRLFDRAERAMMPPLADRAAVGAIPVLAPAFQRRRDINVDRLGRVDRLIAQSQRVAEIYRTLGVAGERLTTLPFTLRHIEHLRPRSLASRPAPVRFATINGCASPSKGSGIIIAALRALRAAGREGSFRLRVLGYVDRGIISELLGYEGVELSGLYRPDEVDALLDDVDVGIMPSIWEEALGYTGLEMIAKGIPLIANPLGGIVEYAREGTTAWLNHSCSGQGLAELMSRLVDEPELVLDMHRRVVASREDVITPFRAHVDAIEEAYARLT